EPGDRDGWAAIFAGGHTAADILQPGFLDPVFAGDRIDLVRKPVGAVISQPDLVDDVGCNQVSVAHADVVAKLGIDNTTLHRGHNFRGGVVHIALEKAVFGRQSLVGANHPL